jgi:hypothetical protein
LDNIDLVDDDGYKILCIIITGSAQLDDQVNLTEVNLHYLIKMMTYERTIRDKVAYFILEADGYIIPTDTKCGRGYRMACHMIGTRYKATILPNWLNFMLNGRRVRPSSTYAMRTKETQQPTLISDSLFPLRNDSKIKNTSVSLQTKN